MMKRNPLLNIKSLKEQVYEYLREQLRRGEILPGSVIDMEETSQKLGVSKTPLRDALLQLEMEDFVSILPRRKVVVRDLTEEDIRCYYEIIGALESMAMLRAAAKMGPADIERMQKLNDGMKKAIQAGNFDQYYARNLEFHNTYLNFSGNRYLIKIVNNLKKRLYDFPRPKGFIKEWEESSVQEHQRVVDLLREKKGQAAADFIRDVHWSFQVQERYIRRYYPQVGKPGD
jgi:DNA-binding GntR family transcriptional regulator